jgi:hypothetical protein
MRQSVRTGGVAAAAALITAQPIADRSPQPKWHCIGLRGAPYNLQTARATSSSCRSIQNDSHTDLAVVT